MRRSFDSLRSLRMTYLEVFVSIWPKGYSQMVGQKYNPSNFLLMHAMGPNVAGVIGSAIAAGVLISLFG